MEVMGSFSLFAVLLLLLFAGGTNAARLYPTSQEFNHEKKPFGLSSIASRTGRCTNESDNSVNYSADRWVQGGEYYGFSVTMDVYDFLLTDDQASFAGVRIVNAGDGAATSLNSIQIGWEVSPRHYGGDSHAHFTAAWTDSASGDWLVHCAFNQPDSKLIGRYPKSLFTDGLADRATHIYIGGAVVTNNAGLVPMGSGYLPTNDTTAASFSNIQIIDQNGQASLVNDNLPGHMSLPDIYSVSPVINVIFTIRV